MAVDRQTAIVSHISCLLVCDPFVWQVVLTCDPKKEAQALCTELVTQTGDLQKEILCLKTLLTKVSHVHIPPWPHLSSLTLLFTIVLSSKNTVRAAGAAVSSLLDVPIVSFMMMKGNHLWTNKLRMLALSTFQGISTTLINLLCEISLIKRVCSLL